MRGVVVTILHRQAGAGSGPLERSLVAARLAVARRHMAGFLEAASESPAIEIDARIESGPPDDTPFGRRLRRLALDAAEAGWSGLVVLGSGAIPLARRRDLRELLDAAASGGRVALANNRYSADAVAIGDPGGLRALPDLGADNALPRWLSERGGYRVADLRGRWRLGVDLDSPLDALILGLPAAGDGDGAPLDRRVLDRVGSVRTLARDPGAELLVAGRTSAATLAWLERSTASRTRALIEERGLRASERLARAADPAPGRAPRRQQRPPRSVLGAVLDRSGPGALGHALAELADGAVIDTRVLLAHRLGADERRWPSAEDRFASDLLRPERIGDEWLRELTGAALGAPIPVLLGGHTLVGPGIRLVLGRPPRAVLADAGGPM
jgi:hypothetical protein